MCLSYVIRVYGIYVCPASTVCPFSAQLAQYESHRAMWEAYNRNKYTVSATLYDITKDDLLKIAVLRMIGALVVCILACVCMTAPHDLDMLYGMSTMPQT